MRSLVRDTLAPLGSWRLLVLQFIGAIVFPISAELWLRIPEAQTWQLGLTLVWMFVWLYLFTWLHSSTLVFAASPQPANFRPAFRPRALRMLWLFLGFLLMFWLFMIITGWSESNLQFTGYLYSKAPAVLRPKGGSLVYSEWLSHALQIIAFFVLPGLLLPAIDGKVLGVPWKRALRTLVNWRYWLVLLVIVHLGLKLPLVLMSWRFGMTVRGQAISLGIRLALALLCGVVSWIMVAGLLEHCLRSPDEISLADARR